MSARVSILMLVHNAPEYVRLAVESVRERTVGIDYELVVVDNASEQETVRLLDDLDTRGLIDRLHKSDENTLFARGNNLAATLADSNATHFLLLNSDVEIHDPTWLSHMIEVHREGATSYGLAGDPLRLDGYCLLIDAHLYRAYPLDTAFEWFWAVTKQQAILLQKGYSVQGYSEHEGYLHHFGGRSGSAFRRAKNLDVSREEVSRWFDGRKPHILDLGSLSWRRRSELTQRGVLYNAKKVARSVRSSLRKARR